MIAPPPPPDPAVFQNVNPAVYVYGDELIRQAVEVGRIRWAAMGRPYTCYPEVFVYDSPDPNEVARAEVPGCRLYFTRTLRNSTWEVVSNSTLSLQFRRNSLANLCKVAVHEEGHNLGLQHSPGTVMDPYTNNMAMPRSCRRWAKETLR